LTVPEGEITAAGLRMNIDIGIRYLASWLSGNGCVPIYNLMEDAATAEISRAQVWQWVRHGARTREGTAVSAPMVSAAIAEQLEQQRRELGAAVFDAGRFEKAGRLFDDMVTGKEFAEFLTLAAYELID
jgi:malate synthase